MRPTIFDGGQVSLPVIRQRSYRIEQQEFFSHASNLIIIICLLTDASTGRNETKTNRFDGIFLEIEPNRRAA